MRGELAPLTEAGARFVALAEEHAADFGTRAGQHDREGSFPSENIQALQKSGFMGAPVPVDLGGMGLETPHDLMVGMSRLARGCASTAIASNMHITGAQAITRLWRRAVATGEERAPVMEATLRAIGQGRLVMCFPTTEPGSDLATPMVEGTARDGGYALNGLKIFGTLSPVANLFLPTFRFLREDGLYGIANAVVLRGTPGMEVLDDWDSLGMRASGSNSVSFKDCYIPKASAFETGGTWGVFGAGAIEIALGPNMSLVSAFLGIAEAAHGIAIDSTVGRKKGPRGKRMAERIPIQQLVAEMEIDLATMRAVIERTGRLADEFSSKYGLGESPDDEAHAMMKEFQCMKYVVNRKAIDVVDLAMTVVGGSAYMAKSPLSRLYRDARAGPFMQPFAPYEALEYIGKVALGEDPVLDR
jgi:alkylation response protein AidB-like acyl-CoA dehydrogenase